ncbi:acetyltransferase [Vibrio sp. 05-20-BW147]|nr:acetyltransferase [Vibrio sp. 05-20-BW147]
MVTVVVIEFGVMRCQPLRRALCFKDKNETFSFYEFSIFDWVCC